MSSKRRDKKRDLSQRQALWDNYGDRIVRSGEIKPQREYARFYCFDCENHFLHRTHDLVVVRRKAPCRPRCKCGRNASQRFSGDHARNAGHMCLPEWDQWDLEKPDRPTCRPEE